MRQLLLPIIASFLTSVAHSATVAQTFTVDGRLYQSSAVGAPVLLDSGTVKISVLSPDASCTLYEEQQNFNTNASDGYFSLLVGSIPGAAKRTSADSGNGMATIFSNTIITGVTGKLAADGTTACTYTPAAGDARLVRVKVTPVSDGVPRTLSPDLVMNSAPAAVVAERAENLQGYGPSSFLVLGNGSTTQGNIDNVFSNTNYLRLADLLSVSSASYVRAGSNGSASAPSVAGNPAAPSAGQFWYDSTANKLKYYDGSSVQSVGAAGVTSVASGTGLTGGPITTTGTLAVDVGTSAGQIVQVQTGGKLPALDASNLSNIPASQLAGAITGSLAISTSSYISTSNNITATGNGTTTGIVTGQTVVAGQLNTNMVRLADGQATPNYVEIKAPNNLGGANKTFTWPASYGSSGYVLSSDGSGALSWIANGSGGGVSSVSQVNGQTVVGGTGANPTVGLATTGVSAATYGSSSQIPILTVDNYGRVTSATFATASVTESDPTVATYAKSATGLSGRLTTSSNQLDLASSGVVAGTYGSSSSIPILSVDTYGRVTVASTTSFSYTETDPNVPSYFKTAPQSRLVNNAGKLDLGNSGVSAATYGSSTQVPVITVDQYGRITLASTAAVSVSETDPSVATYAKSATGLSSRLTTSTNQLDLASSGVSAGTYGSSSQIPIFTVDTYGRVTTASYLSASIAPSQISQGGASNNNVLKWNGSNWTATAVSNLETDPTVATYAKSAPSTGLTVNGSNQIQLATSGVSAATYGSATQVPVLTVDQYGRITLASTAAVSVSETDPSVATYAKAATGLSGRLTTTSNQLDLASSGVSAATYGSASQVSKITVDAYGRITSAVNTTIDVSSTVLSADWDVDGASSGTRKITGLADPTASDGAATKAYVTSAVSAVGGSFITKDGLTALTADWDIDGASSGTRKITGLADPTASDGAATKNYVDGKFTLVQAASFGSAAAPSLSFVSDSDTGIYEASANYLGFTTGGSEKMVIDSSGKVGIGNSAPAAKFQVAGAMVSDPSDIASGGAVDLSLSNTFTLQSVTGNAITLSNPVHGGVYTLVIADTASRTYNSWSGCTNTYYKPAIAATTAGTQSIFTVMTIKSGVNWNCYITWGTGYQ